MVPGAEVAPGGSLEGGSVCPPHKHPLPSLWARLSEDLTVNKRLRKPLRHERRRLSFTQINSQRTMQRKANPIRQSHKLGSQEPGPGSWALSLKHLPGSCPWGSPVIAAAVPPLMLGLIHDTGKWEGPEWGGVGVR